VILEGGKETHTRGGKGNEGGGSAARMVSQGQRKKTQERMLNQGNGGEVPVMEKGYKGLFLSPSKGDGIEKTKKPEGKGERRKRIE